MINRSMPPFSAHLAEMPVPAPPPMIGLPAASWARNRSRICSRVKKLMTYSICRIRISHLLYATALRMLVVAIRTLGGLLLPGATRRDVEQCSCRRAKLGSPPQRGGGLPLGGVLAGIARVHGETRQQSRTHPQRTQLGVVRQQQGDKVFEDMRVRHGLTKLLQKRFQVLLGDLVRVERDFIMMGILSARE